MENKRVIRVGEVFDRLTVIEDFGRDPKKEETTRQFLCLCECDNRRVVSKRYLLRKGEPKSCGICNYESRMIKVGEVFGRLTVMGAAPKNKHGERQLLCLCECGIEKMVAAWALVSSNPITSCGCLHIKHTIKIGDRFGKLVIIDQTKNNPSTKQQHRAFLCQCDCGQQKVIRIDNLMESKGRAPTRSCGCLRRERGTPINIGDKFGRLTIVGNTDWKMFRTFICQCDCGSPPKEIRAQYLLNGRIQSCGCLGAETKRIALANDTNEVWASEYAYYKKENAVERDLEFSLTKEQFIKIVLANCDYCGEPPSTLTKTGIPKLLRNGIDRMDNNKGYTSDNCVSCCFPCNKMKMSLGREAFLEHIFKITDHQRTKKITADTAA